MPAAEAKMRIVCRVDGGLAVFPGLARPFSVDVDALPAAQADAFRAVVAKTRFFDRADPPPSSAAPDQRRYEVTIHDGARRRTMTIDESTTDPALRDLIHALEQQRRSTRAS